MMTLSSDEWYGLAKDFANFNYLGAHETLKNTLTPRVGQSSGDSSKCSTDGKCTNADGSYYDPYYNSGEGTFTFVGSFAATVNFEELIPWMAIIWGYVFLSCMGPFLFPPFAICLFAENGDLNMCSLGIWGTGYKNPNFKCHNKTDWSHTQLTDAQATCYYNRFSSSDLAAFSADNLCDLKIEWDSYGYNSGRDSTC